MAIKESGCNRKKSAFDIKHWFLEDHSSKTRLVRKFDLFNGDEPLNGLNNQYTDKVPISIAASVYNLLRWQELLLRKIKREDPRILVMDEFLDVGYSKDYWGTWSWEHVPRLIDVFVDDLTKLQEEGKIKLFNTDKKLLGLEAGSGRGGPMFNLLERKEFNAQIIGLDYLFEQVEKAKSNSGKHPDISDSLPLLLVNGDAQRLPVGGESLDFVYSVEAVTHFPRMREFIKEANRSLKKNGSFFYSILTWEGIRVDQVYKENGVLKRKGDNAILNVEESRQLDMYIDFCRAWNVPIMHSDGEHKKFIGDEGFQLLKDTEISGNNLKHFGKTADAMNKIFRLPGILPILNKLLGQQIDVDFDRIFILNKASAQAINSGLLGYNIYYAKKT